MTENNPTPDSRVLKAPPLLLGATLLFWGWQSGLPLIGAVMGIILESARVVKVRWELSDTDFRRILTFCTLFALAATLYVFTDTQEASGGFHGPSGAVGRAMGISSLKTSTTFFRWLPMFLFFFVAAQLFSTREKIPLTAISIISRWRSQRDEKHGADAGHCLNVSYPYFIVCLFSASVHSNNNEGSSSFFWGQCVLIFWALWHFRSRRSGILIWALALAVVTILGNFGQHGIGFLQRKIENYDAQWLSHFMRTRVDPTESITTMGQIGELKLSGSIVIRLRTKNGESPPAYLREASYRRYQPKDKSWYYGSSRIDFDIVNPLTNQTTFILLPKKTNTASVNMACYLDSGKALLPLPTGSGRLENLPAYVLQKNSEGAVLAEGPGLVIFDALYGPGATIDSAPGVYSSTNMDFFVPTNEIPALDSVISEMKISGTSEEKELLAVQSFFAGKFTYSLWQGQDKLATTNETTLTRFCCTAAAAIANTLPPRRFCCCANWEFPHATLSVTPSTKREAAATSCARATRTRGASCGTSRQKRGKILIRHPDRGSASKASARPSCNGSPISGRGSALKFQSSAGDKAT